MYGQQAVPFNAKERGADEKIDVPLDRERPQRTGRPERRPLQAVQEHPSIRFARIYSGLIPALVFVIVVDWITLRLTSEPTIARSYNLKTLVANLGMLEGCFC
jgi:hypothetical protein